MHLAEQAREILDAAENASRQGQVCSEMTILISPEGDIPGPDNGTNAQIMAWIMDTYSMHKGYSMPAVVTGKPVEIGGTEGRSDAAGLGLSICTVQAMMRFDIPVSGASAAVQGFGYVGQAAARCPF